MPFLLRKGCNCGVGLFRETVASVLDGLAKLRQYIRTPSPSQWIVRFAPFGGLLKDFSRPEMPQGPDGLPWCLIVVITGECLSEKLVNVGCAHNSDSKALGGSIETVVVVIAIFRQPF